MLGIGLNSISISCKGTTMGYWGYRVVTPKYHVPSRSELVDLLVSWAVLTLAFGAGYVLRGNLVLLGVSAIAVATAFIFHELAHREVARRYGLVARYKAWYTGLALALALAFITAKITGNPFVLAAPGAVMIFSYYGSPPPHVSARVAAAGPLANIIVGIVFSITSLAMGYPWRAYLGFIGSVNLWIAFFNLIPLPPLDGSKIMRYSFMTWLTLFLVALTLLMML